MGRVIKRQETLGPGDAIRTNARFQEIVGNAAPYSGTLVKPVTWLDGCWHVNMRGFIRPLLVHASLMEKVR